MGTRIIKLNVNKRTYEVPLKPQWTLSHVLRNTLGLTGTKEGCGKGACGSCTVVVDGRAVPSCMMLAIEQEGKEIETVEGLAPRGKLNPIQEAWLDEYGAQCGFCSPGMIMSSKALLDRNPNPTEREIRKALAGNICICSNYEHIVNAIKLAADRMGRSRKNA